VLLGGDALAIWRSLSLVLQQRGHLCKFARKKDEALAVLREDPIDAVIMDLETWGCEVFHTARAIRALPDRCKAQVLLLTILAEDWEDGRERCLATGIDWCCSPPVVSAELVAAAERLAAKCLLHGEIARGDSAARSVASTVTVSPNLPVSPQQNGTEVLERTLPVFDRQQALHQCFGSEKILQQMAAYLLEHADRQLNEIVTAVRLGSRDALRASAHQLKGTVLHLGSPRTVLALKRLEQLPWADDMADAAAAVEEAARQVQRLKKAIHPIATSCSVPPEVGA
jgi:CheY-like chemotaxis protein/HPt (histidine-containing phosphotransfer) domain-containing protein